jgi:ribosomal protein S27E
VTAQPIPKERTGSGQNFKLKCVLCGHVQELSLPVDRCEIKEDIKRKAALSNVTCIKCGE